MSAKTRVEQVPTTTNKIKLAIVGSRIINDFRILDCHGAGGMSIMGFEWCDVSHIVSGGAKGVDKLAEKAYRKYKNIIASEKIKLKVFKPDYDTYPGHIAPLERNTEIVDYCDAAIVIWDTFSDGTRDTIKKLSEARKPFVLVNVFVRYNPLEFVVKEIQFITEYRWKDLYEKTFHPKRNRRRRGTSS